MSNYDLNQVQNLINNLSDEDKLQLSDGHSTFDDLYAHRNVLWIRYLEMIRLKYELRDTMLSYLSEELLEEAKKIDVDRIKIYKCKKHHDGTSKNNWFISMLITGDNKQISYFLPMSCWNVTPGEEYDVCPVNWDGHTIDDTLEILNKGYAV